MLRSFIYMLAGLTFSARPAAALPAHPPLHKVVSLKITVLSTMLADRGMGEWGFSVLVEADGHRILFDTGMHPQTVLDNARDLGIDLSNVTDVVLSHHHGDHTGGLVELRQELSKRSPGAMSRIHVAPGIFLSRRTRAATTRPTRPSRSRPQWSRRGRSSWCMERRRRSSPASGSPVRSPGPTRSATTGRRRAS